MASAERSILTRRDPLYSDSDSESYSDSDEEEYESAIMEADQDIIREIHQLFTEAFVWKWFCDFTVVVEGVKVKCHRFILNACSGFFEALFMCERREKRVTIQGISFEICMLILNDIYSGFNILTVENMLDVWKASHQLIIDYLTTKCEYFIIENISEENVFPIYFVAKQLVSDNVKHCLSNYMTSNFSSIVLSDSLAQLAYEDFLNILENIEQEGNLNVQHIQAILKWSGAIEKKAHCNKKYSPNLKKLKSLILALDLSKASPECLAAIMTNEFIIKDQELITEINKHVAKFLNQSMNQSRSNKEVFNRPGTENVQKYFVSKPLYDRCLFDCLTEVAKQEMFCDFTVVVGDEKFPCHMFVLKVCSKYFKDLFDTICLKEGQNMTTIEDTSPNIFKMILFSIYSGSNIINEDNILELWHSAHKLQITFLRTSCENFVIARIHSENCHIIYQHSMLLGSVNVKVAVLTYILHNFQSVVLSNNFSKLLLEAVLKTLQNKTLQVSTDLQISSILMWSGADEEQAQETNDNLQHLGKLISCVDLEYARVECLITLLKNKFIQNNDEALALINSHSAKIIKKIFQYSEDD